MDVPLVTAIAEELCASRGWGRPRFVRAGNSGAVFRAVTTEHGESALKIYDPTFFVGANALIEVRRVRLQEELRSHGNPFLVNVLEVGEIPDRGTWYVLMEFCTWPALDERIAQVPDDRVQQLL